MDEHDGRAAAVLHDVDPPPVGGGDEVVLGIGRQPKAGIDQVGLVGPQSSGG